MRKYVDGHLVDIPAADAGIFEKGRAVDPAAALAAARGSWSCTQMQGILALGESKWGEVLAYRAGASWAEKVIIDSAQDWRRTSQNVQFIGYLVGFTDEQMDALFIAAIAADLQ